MVYLAVWTTIANSQGSVSGLTANDFITYYLTLLIVDQLTSEITIHLLAYKIQDGTLSGDLLRPIHPILTNTLINNIAFKALTFIGADPGLARAVPALPPRLQRSDRCHPCSWQSRRSCSALPSASCWARRITCLAFWTTRVYAIGEFYSALVILFSGQFVPLQLMPPAIQRLARLPAFPDVQLRPDRDHPQPAAARSDLAQLCAGPGLVGHLHLSFPLGLARGSQAFLGGGSLNLCTPCACSPHFSKSTSR